MAIESINPANGKLLRSFEALTEEVISEKIALAAETFRTYPSIPLEHRALCMNKLASLLEQEADEIAPTLTLEMGKPIHAARQEVAKCATACRYYAENAASILAFRSHSSGKVLALTLVNVIRILLLLFRRPP